MQPMITCASYTFTVPPQYLQAIMEKKKLALVLEVTWVSGKQCTHARLCPLISHHRGMAHT